MPTLMPWNSVEIGDLDVFAPALPSFVVYTWYVDDEPESSVTYFWADEDTGLVRHELLLVGPIAFEEAVTRAQEEAPKRKVERIHVKHARASGKTAGAKRAAAKPSAAKAGAAKAGAVKPAKAKAAKPAKPAIAQGSQPVAAKAGAVKRAAAARK
jgi:hypothetical protein